MVLIGPSVVLGALSALTGLAVLLDALARRRRTRELRALAAELRMNYSPRDVLRLAPRVAGRLPLPGAADVLVRDVIYRTEGDRYRYIFTAEYTFGAVRRKSRVLRVATFTEPRDRTDGDAIAVTLAPSELSLQEQYRTLAQTDEVPDSSPESGEA